MWYLNVLLADILWSSGNFIDKYLVTGEAEEGSNIGGIVVISTLIVIPVMIVTYLIEPVNLFSVSLNEIPLIASGVAYATTWIVPYLYAISLDDTSTVVPLFQTIPIYSYILGFHFLDETLTLIHLSGSSLTMIGSIIISTDLKRFSFKWRKFGAMFVASFSVALANMLFKIGTTNVDKSLANNLFWEYLGISIIGLIYLLFVRKFKSGFYKLINQNGATIFSLNILTKC